MEVIEYLQQIRDMLIGDMSMNEATERVASAEIFDTSNIDDIEIDVDYSVGITNEGKELIQGDILKKEALTLPFPNVFIRTGERELKLGKHEFLLGNYIFITELSPYQYAGIFYCPVVIKNTAKKRGVGNPFVISDETLFIMGIENETQEQKKTARDIIFKTLYIMSNLPKQQVHSYTLKNSKPEYWRRKGASTIKIANRPIYYVINKEDKPSKIRVDHSKGYLKCEYSFKVRGHWRTLHNPKTIGLDRNGQRTVKGFTWIKEYIKGEGDLVKRVRVVH